MPTPKLPWAENELLASLPPKVLERLRPHAELLPLALNQVICEPGGGIPHVYFPTGGVISLVSVMPGSPAVETAAIGREGMVGIQAFLGSSSMPTRAFVQVAGAALRVESGPFRLESDRARELHRLMLVYTEVAFNQVSRTAACNRVHGTRERCSRWLLTTQDCVSRSRFALTQEFLAQMLGVRRATVNAAARGLQQDGLITYSRGRITVLDRGGLEAASCECYGVIRDDRRRLMKYAEGLQSP